MNDIEGRLRDAFEHEASKVTEESLRPAEPPSTSEPDTPASRWSAATQSRWIWPAAAAAAVAAVTIGISAIHGDARGPNGPATTQTKIGPTTTKRVDSGLPLPEKGRNYDVGSVLGSDTMTLGGALEIFLHRWQVIGSSDAEVAAHGIPVVAHTDFDYKNLSQQIYVAPVAKGATFILNRCTSISSLRHDHVTVDQFLQAGSLSGVVFRFDSEGRIIEAQTDGGC